MPLPLPLPEPPAAPAFATPPESPKSPEPPPPPKHRLAAVGRRTASVLGRPWLLALVGFFLVAMGWAFASPMSTSPDEPSHMIKAAATARGEFVNSSSRHEITNGFEKTWLGYPLPAKYKTIDAMSSCFRFQLLSAACGKKFGTDNSTAIVETSAGNYNPAYYFPVGLPSLWLPGVSALYGMRLASALLNSALLAAAVGIAAGWRRPGWPILGVVACGTPMALFLSGTVNSNGMEATAAVLAWTAAMSLALDDDPKPGQVTRRAIGLAIGGALLANTRSLGIAFSASVLIALVIIAGPRKVAWLARFRAVQVMAVVLILGGVAAFLWNRYSDTLTTSNLSFPTLTPGAVAIEVFWNSGNYISQVVGNLGWLDVALPPGTSIAWYAVAGLLILCAFGVGRWREAAVVAALVVGTVAIPIIAQVLEAKRFGIGWQGRYILAWVLGLPVLAGLLMARRVGKDLPGALERRVPIAATIVLGLAGLGAFYWSMTRYMHGGFKKYGISPVLWSPPGGWIVWWVVYSAGLVVLVAAVAVRRRQDILR
ncbi:DUF2142 domain-containing protein [Catenulispora acidiphila]|uniref:DUF2142 domain-containing protein n=1 Tax=Catenulispora acidiphila TaxID=304895 RepID=UPI0005A0030E|nr:DUF2142 domain-containing protein [Catenulispora acidiphila]